MGIRLGTKSLYAIKIYKHMRIFKLFFVLLISQSINLYSQNIPKDIPKKVDLGVDGIMLVDTSNVKETLGLSDEPFNLALKQYIEPHFNYVNEDTTELLVLIFHPGSNEYQFNEFKILNFSKNFSEKFIVLPNIKNFRTYKGLTLGISIGKLKNVLGMDFKRVVLNDKVTLKYSLTNSPKQNSQNLFLKFYNMPSYYGNYTFTKNKLVKIEFGFEYP